MKAIMIEAKTYQKLLDTIKSLSQKIKIIEQGDYQPLEQWLDAQDVCLLLNISKRTLQTYRDNGSLPFSQKDQKIFYRSDDVQKLFNKKK